MPILLYEKKNEKKKHFVQCHFTLFYSFFKEIYIHTTVNYIIMQKGKMIWEIWISAKKDMGNLDAQPYHN